MADDSELDYIRTFFLKVHTAATAKQASEVPESGFRNIGDSQKITIGYPSIIGRYLNVFEKRYHIVVHETSEANLATALNNILDGINKVNKRQTITDFTKPSTWVHAEFFAGDLPAMEVKKSGRWQQDFYLHVEWATS